MAMGATTVEVTSSSKVMNSQRHRCMTHSYINTPLNVGRHRRKYGGACVIVTGRTRFASPVPGPGTTAQGLDPALSWGLQDPTRTPVPTRYQNLRSCSWLARCADTALSDGQLNISSKLAVSFTVPSDGQLQPARRRAVGARGHTPYMGLVDPAATKISP